MNRIFTILAGVLFLTVSIFAQSPEKMSYQAIIRDASDNLVTDTSVGMKIGFLQGSASGTAVYVETQTPTTNANGLISLEIGTGITTDDFSAIDWASGLYFIKTETDPSGGTNYTVTSISQLLSVPYALHSKISESLIFDRNGRTYDFYFSDAGTIMGLPRIEIKDPFPSEPTITDYDGNVYNTLKIGNQVWIKENLKVTHYANGIAIPLVEDNSTWGSLNDTSKAYCYYNNDTNGEAAKYGALYTFAAATNGNTNSTNPNGIQGVCPVGWHLPSKVEWIELINYLGTIPGGRMKEIGTTLWRAPNTDAINDSEFSALPSGMRSYGNGLFFEADGAGAWWSSTQVNSKNAFWMSITWWQSNAGMGESEKSYGFSVRCIKNSE